VSTPNHIINDFSFKKPNATISYWVLQYTTNYTKKPSFLDDTITTKLSNQYNHSCEWSNFLKNNFVSQNTKTLSNLRLTKNTPHKKTLDTYHINNSININFLRSERLYTKLKYSRSPAYDIVSGGAAALFAGFLGFLISEKFGFELVDSGDFYYLFMYIVFAIFMVKPFLYISSTETSPFNSLSVKNLINFYLKLFVLLTSLFKA